MNGISLEYVGYNLKFSFGYILHFNIGDIYLQLQSFLLWYSHLPRTGSTDFLIINCANLDSQFRDHLSLHCIVAYNNNSISELHSNLKVVCMFMLPSIGKKSTRLFCQKGVSHANPPPLSLLARDFGSGVLHFFKIYMFEFTTVTWSMFRSWEGIELKLNFNFVGTTGNSYK